METKLATRDRKLSDLEEIMAAIEILVNTKASLEKIEFSERLKS